MMTTAFWKAALERAIRTFAQALIATLTTGATDLLDVSWGGAFSAAGMAAVLSVLTSIAFSGTGPSGPGMTESTAAPAGAETASAGSAAPGGTPRPPGGGPGGG
jgi:hypothetical protein